MKISANIMWLILKSFHTSLILVIIIYTVVKRKCPQDLHQTNMILIMKPKLHFILSVIRENVLNIYKQSEVYYGVTSDAVGTLCTRYQSET